MGFKRLLASMGAGGASVETVLRDPQVSPGGAVEGEVRIEGGSVDQRIDGLYVGLRARVEVEAGDSEYTRDIDFQRVQLGGELHLTPGAHHTVPFSLPVPLETPLNVYAGRQLPGTRIGVGTELDIARAIDAGDLDPILVHPLPAQRIILDALGSLGFGFKLADLEQGQLRGTRQRLPFYQEIELTPAPQYHGLNELEVSFVADERAVDVVLEMDKKSGLLTEGRDTYHSFTVDHDNVNAVDWAAELHQWIHSVAGKRNWL